MYSSGIGNLEILQKKDTRKQGSSFRVAAFSNDTLGSGVCRRWPRCPTSFIYITNSLKVPYMIHHEEAPLILH